MISGWAWLAWIVGTLLVFGLLEYKALTNGPREDALTHNLRRVFRVHTKSGAFLFLLVLAVLAFLLIWLGPHVISGAVNV